MRQAGAYICALVAFVCTGCDRADTYGPAAATADSLSGGLGSLVKALERNDTLLVQKALNRFAEYSLFIRQNIHDTVQKAEADNLQHFYAGGYKVSSFATNRKLILARAGLMRQQLTRLSVDIRSQLPDAQGLSQALMLEREEADKLMDQGRVQQDKFQAGWQELTSALPGVEALIRSRNRGELPTVITDTVSF